MKERERRAQVPRDPAPEHGWGTHCRIGRTTPAEVGPNEFREVFVKHSTCALGGCGCPCHWPRKTEESE